MKQLTIYTLGKLEIIDDKLPVKGFVSQKKSEALLAYLALNPSQHSRQTLTNLFWADFPEKRALNNLSVLLSNIKKKLGSYLHISRGSIGFAPQANISVDARILLDSAAELQASSLTKESISKFSKALKLYKGDFLDTFYVSKARNFEAWMTAERERLRRQTLKSISLLLEYHKENYSYLEGINVARKAIKFDALNENSNYQLIYMLALTGQRSEALEHFEAYRQRLIDDYELEPEEKILALINKIHTGEIRTEASVSPVATKVAPFTSPFQVAAAPPHFVGREKESAELKRNLHQARICALVGMGGAGKSTLAVQVGHNLRHQFDGVLWVNVASSEPMSTLNLWAKAFGFEFMGLSDIESRSAALRSVFAKKNVLIILDNVDKVSQVQPFISAAGSSAVLLTTRDQDVSHALNAHVVQLAEFPASAARALLISILGESRVKREEAAAREIGVVLHYLPLAVEIAAQRLKSRRRMPLSAMAERLQTMQNRLDLGISDLAVRTSFEMSWNSLSDEHKQFYPLLAVFEGRPFDPEAIAYVAQVDKFTAEDYLYTLTALSLIREEDAAYYKQHPLLADFAMEKLGDSRFRRASLLTKSEQSSNGVEVIYLRMTNYYLQLATEASNHLKGKEQVLWLIKLESAYQNIRAALTYLLKKEEFDRLQRFFHALYLFWETRNYWFDLIRYYEKFFDLVSNDKKYPKLRAEYAHTFYRLGDYKSAKKHAELALRGTDIHEDSWAKALALRVLAIVADDTESSEKALTIYEESLRYFREAQDEQGVVHVLNDMANASYFLGLEEQCLNYGQQSYELALKIGDKRAVATSLFNKANLMSDNSKFELAEELCQNALAIAQELKDEFMEAAASLELGLLEKRRKNYIRAKQLIEHAHRLSKKMGDKMSLPAIYCALAELEISQAKEEQGLCYYKEALRICKEVDIKRNGFFTVEKVSHYLTVSEQSVSLMDICTLLLASERLRESYNMQALKSQGILNETWQVLFGKLDDRHLAQAKQKAVTLDFSDMLELALTSLNTVIDPVPT